MLPSPEFRINATGIAISEERCCKHRQAVRYARVSYRMATKQIAGRDARRHPSHCATTNAVSGRVLEQVWIREDQL